MLNKCIYIKFESFLIALYDVQQLIWKYMKPALYECVDITWLQTQHW
jgi:hypothetical protein